MRLPRDVVKSPPSCQDAFSSQLFKHFDALGFYTFKTWH